MYRDRGLIIRSIPYSDSARIMQCFSETKGLVSIFLRMPSKRRLTGHLRNGSFIEFTANQRANASMLSLTDSRWDPNVPTDVLDGEQAALWTFVLEVLQKSLKEHFALPKLLQRMRVYYVLLSCRNTTTTPLLPLIAISSDLGICDLEMVFRMADKTLKQEIKKLGFNPSISVTDVGGMSETELFNLERDRFQEHFNIDSIDSLYLLE